MPVMPAFKPTTDFHRKEMIKELTELNHNFLHLENKFARVILDETDTRSYKEVYLLYLSKFNRILQDLVKKRKFRITWVNRQHFAQQYKPREVWSS
jgi:hypothetical protein